MAFTRHKSVRAAEDTGLDSRNLRVYTHSDSSSSFRSAPEPTANSSGGGKKVDLVDSDILVPTHTGLPYLYVRGTPSNPQAGLQRL